jgi:hypothetical protein
MRGTVTSIAVVAILVVGGTGAVVWGVGAPVAADGEGTKPVCAGTIDRRPAGMTVVSVQGYRFEQWNGTTEPRVIGYAPNGSVAWVHHTTDAFEHASWSYDVDPLGNGTLFVTAAVNRPSWDHGRSVFYVLDARTGEVRWQERVPLWDTHDADLLDSHRILIANMRNADPQNGTNDEGLVIYNRTSDEVVWRWRLADHYPRSVGWNYTRDWSHINDVDRVAEGLYLASPRNFDQVILVNRTTGEIDLRLGENGNHSILRKQHNPTYLESEDGDPTFLVADSRNDRIVEYERDDGAWTRTWHLGGPSSLSFPRDADRLPNGNTLIADSSNHRVIEVTPDGEVVWEVFTPWLTYEVERVPFGDEPRGPTTADQGATVRNRITGSAPRSEATLQACDRYLNEFETDWPGREEGGSGSWDVGDGAGHSDGSLGTPVDAPDGGDGAGPWPLPGNGSTVGLAALVLGALLVLGAILVRRR